jgi:predicted DNA binding CopG/RHH family protein
MNQKIEIKKSVTVRVPIVLHRKVRVKLFENGVTFQRFLVDKLTEFAGGAEA